MVNQTLGLEHYVTTNTYLQYFYGTPSLYGLGFRHILGGGPFLLLSYQPNVDKVNSEIDRIIKEYRFIEFNGYFIMISKKENPFKTSVVSLTTYDEVEIPWFEHEKLTDQQLFNKIKGYLVFL